MVGMSEYGQQNCDILSIESVQIQPKENLLWSYGGWLRLYLGFFAWHEVFIFSVTFLFPQKTYYRDCAYSICDFLNSSTNNSCVSSLFSSAIYAYTGKPDHPRTIYGLICSVDCSWEGWNVPILFVDSLNCQCIRW